MLSVDDDPRLDGLRLFKRDTERAIATGAPVIRRDFAVGDQVVRFQFIGQPVERLLTPAIAHLAVEPVGTPDLTVHVWDTASTGCALSPLLAALVDGAGTGSLSSRREVRLLTDDAIQTTVTDDMTLTMFDGTGSVAYYWTRDANTLPYWELGAPFRSLFNWWLSARSRYCVHAAAVGTSTGAVLLAGRGGSGKSTSALACLGTRLKYLSDDYCVYEAGDQPTVFSLYNTGKLNGAEDLARQPRFSDWVVNPERIGQEKLLMYLQANSPEDLLNEAPISAIILPRVTADDGPRLVRASSAAALFALAPTTLFQLPGSGERAMRSMAELVRQVPCYTLQTGHDVAAIPPLLERLLTHLRSTEQAPSSLT